MWIESLKIALSLDVMIYVVFGTVVGIIIGALPGLGPMFTLALFVSMTFVMTPAQALVFLAALYGSCVFGGSISSILLNTPGTPGSIATTFDGYPLAKKGEGGRALGAAATASFFGGIVGVAAVALLGPVLAELSLVLGPAEYFMLTLAGLSMVAVASQGDTTRGLIMAGLGLMLSFVGRDVITGALRFTLGTFYLEDGIDDVPLAIGLFAFSQALILANERGSIAGAKSESVSGIWQGIKDTIARPINVIRSSVIGVFLGILPGVGINAANFIAYLAEKSSSKKKDTFGKGNIAGVIAPESSNNACSLATLIPTFGLGIPGSNTSALFLAALMIHGITPGYDFYTASGHLFATVIWGMVIAQFAFLILGLLGARYFVKVTQIPNALIVPGIVLLAFVGSFGGNREIMDVMLMIITGLLGYYLVIYKYPMACLILGSILGNLAEHNFNRALRISHGSYGIFFNRPVSLVLFIIIIFSISLPYIKPYLGKMVPWLKGKFQTK